ncbi:hypothetical protein L861_14130 [Litchfieldella anticariensis FP35 = DSM 16096]|uniref:Uncharacterized protein n=1 Tax=Litchfieldella anticariensis (strain DSM 16096 / CECT 5854 / CIP 108499 / LMG 22089 / FP35) TaxID=1121939 RepID=S2KE13_LITA3|nr:hypothetical protein [Halomonas anticariensis]EPC00407.1 hypothetical protein L861_14130 [Halomonas anticariensis FP35 = DSM 16096]
MSSTHDMSALAQRHGWTRSVRVSESLLSDCLCVALTVATDIHPVDRLEHLLREAAIQLAGYPPGTRAARFCHYRLPPDGNPSAPLGIMVDAIVIDDDPQRGPYLLLARHDDTSVALPITAA